MIDDSLGMVGLQGKQAGSSRRSGEHSGDRESADSDSGLPVGQRGLAILDLERLVGAGLDPVAEAAVVGGQLDRRLAVEFCVGVDRYVWLLE
ncbi:MAG: hypothetical protein M3Y17_11820 [Actinomycetota bacterium]|nr:hypothetical protein [Actinomycetota bacterium]